MKTKSRAVRRNSCGYGLQDDVGVSGGAAVNDGRSPTPVLEDFGFGVSVSLQEDSVSGDAIIRGDGFGSCVDVDGSLGCYRSPCRVVDAPVRISGGITINEPDSYRASADARSQRLPGSVDYVGKGKRKVDDVLPPSYHGSGDVAVSFSAPSLAAMNTNHVFSASSSQSGVGSSRVPCIISQPSNAPATPQTHDLASVVLPVGQFQHHQQPDFQGLGMG